MLKLDYWLLVALMLNDRPGLLAACWLMLNTRAGTLTGGFVDDE
jgi:hypothetical protein